MLEAGPSATAGRQLFGDSLEEPSRAVGLKVAEILTDPQDLAVLTPLAWKPPLSLSA